MRVVLDTNIVMDLWVFREPAAAALDAAIAGGKVTWLATAAMREELACVLSYPQIGARMARAHISARDVLAAFDGHAQLVDPAPGAAVRCRDPDDQKFVDLAVAHGALLLSKDAQVLKLRRKLAVAQSL